ncbi:MAG: hypothetical protein ACP5UA_09770 [Candidatus Hydrogenedens sp.]
MRKSVLQFFTKEERKSSNRNGKAKGGDVYRFVKEIYPIYVRVQSESLNGIR